MAAQEEIDVVWSLNHCQIRRTDTEAEIKRKKGKEAETKRERHLTPTGETDTIILTDNLSVGARSIQ